MALTDERLSTPTVSGGSRFPDAPSQVEDAIDAESAPPIVGNGNGASAAGGAGGLLLLALLAFVAMR